MPNVENNICVIPALRDLILHIFKCDFCKIKINNNIKIMYINIANSLYGDGMPGHPLRIVDDNESVIFCYQA